MEYPLISGKDSGKSYMLRICKWAYYAKKRHMFTSRKQEIYSVRSQNLLSGKRGEEKLFSFLHPTLFFWQRKERKKVKYQERAKGHFFLLFSLKLPKRRQITDSLSFLSLPRTIIIIFQRGEFPVGGCYCTISERHRAKYSLHDTLRRAGNSFLRALKWMMRAE